MPEQVKARTFQEASVDVAMDAYPLVKSLKAGPTASLGSKVVALAATGDSREIIETIDAGLAAFLSVPPGAACSEKYTIIPLHVTGSAPHCHRSPHEDGRGAEGGALRGRVGSGDVQQRIGEHVRLPLPLGVLRRAG